jgi:hypothetical protein
LLWLLSAGAAPLAAQTTGQIEGMVRDPAGRPTVETAVRLLETGTGSERRLSTDEQGWYLALGLAPGTYEIEVSRSGFRGETRRGVTLVAGRTVRVDFSLVLGETRESVVVVGDAPPVSAAARDWGGYIEQKKLESLPFNGRDLYDIVSQQPGVLVARNASRSIDTGLGARVSVNGARPNQNSFRMDGIHINDASSLAPASAGGRLLGLESIQELQLVSSPFDAEYGRSGGAAIVAVAKSGSNQWHGSGYEFLRNSALDAKNFFDPAADKIPPLRKNQFGVLLGGPLRRNLVFLMANYEAIRMTSGQTLSSVTPTAEARAGRLPDQVITVSPLIVPYLDLYPLPNGRDYGDGTGQFVTQGITSAREDYVTGKLDYIRSSRLRFAGRYTYDNAANQRPDPVQVFTFRDDSHYHFLHTETQFIQSPSSVHTFRAGFSRVWNGMSVSQPASIPASLSFIPGQPLGYLQVTAGLSSISGLVGTSIGLMPRRHASNDFQANYAFTHVRGRHSFRSGGSLDRIQFNQRSDRGVKGAYVFSSLVDLLRARPRSGEMLAPGSDTIRGWRQTVVSGFAQEEYRASARLSLTAGLRYEAYSTPAEVNGKMATLKDFLGDTAFTVGGPVFRNPSKTNFAPRVSVALLPFRSARTVLRAGVGVFFDLLGTREISTAGVRVPPFYELLTLTSPSFPNLPLAMASASPDSQLDMLDYYLQQPYSAQFQFLVQQELAGDTVLQVGYSGGRGVHLPGQIAEANPVRPDTLPDGSLYFPQNTPRLNPAFGRTRTRRTQFNSMYHGLQAQFQRKWRGGLLFQVKYAWGKALDETSSTFSREYVNNDGLPTMFNYRLNHGRSDFDLSHTFGANFSWALPQVPHAAIGKVFSGWELQGLVQAQSGPPFNPFVGFDRPRLSAGSSNDAGQRPNYVGPPGARVILGDPRQWFDPNFFALPAAGTYGNLGRNGFDGPGLAAVDLAAHKVVWRTERQSIRLRLEAFNVVNHPNFQLPSVLTLFTSSLARVGSAGQITETSTTSRQIQLALKWVF